MVRVEIAALRDLYTVVNRGPLLTSVPSDNSIRTANIDLRRDLLQRTSPIFRPEEADVRCFDALDAHRRIPAARLVNPMAGLAPTGFYLRHAEHAMALLAA